MGIPHYWLWKIWAKPQGHKQAVMNIPAPWPYRRPEFLQQLDGLVGEEIWPLDVPLLVGVQGGELQSGSFLLCLLHGPLKLLLVHQVLVVQEVVQCQGGFCEGTFRAALPPAFPQVPRSIPPISLASLLWDTHSCHLLHSLYLLPDKVTPQPGSHVQGEQGLKGSGHCITGKIRTWDDLALPQGLHQAVHLLLCQQEVEVVLEGKAGRVLASSGGSG